MTNLPQAVTVCIPRKGPGGILQVLGISRGTDLLDWGQIGGKVDPGESLEQAIIREAFEEARIKIRKPVPVFSRVDDAGHFHCTTFMISSFLRLSTFPYVGKEGTVDWIPVDQLTLDTCSFRDYNRDLIKHLGL